jgi:Lipocalin-like domain
MKRFHFFLLFALILASRSFGQSKIKSTDKLIGTWRLIEAIDLDSATSTWTYPFGKNPIGFFTYTKSGIVNLNISTDTPLKISEDSAKNYNINLLKWLDHYAVGYFGTYTVDFDKSVVTHHVKGGSLPWYNDTDQPRPFILKGDTLILGDHKTWKRVLVKAD